MRFRPLQRIDDVANDLPSLVTSNVQAAVRLIKVDSSVHCTSYRSNKEEANQTASQATGMATAVLDLHESPTWRQRASTRGTSRLGHLPLHRFNVCPAFCCIRTGQAMESVAGEYKPAAWTTRPRHHMHGGFSPLYDFIRCSATEFEGLKEIIARPYCAPLSRFPRRRVRVQLRDGQELVLEQENCARQR